MEPEKDGQPDDEEGTDSEFEFMKTLAKAKAEETPIDEIAEVIVEKPKGVWGWFIGLFS